MKKYVWALLVLCWGHAHTQSLYDNTNVTTIEIFFSTSNWDQILDNYYAAGMDQRLIADSVVINGSMKDSVGVKYKGNSTYNANNDKNPLNLSLDYIQGNQDYQGFRTIKLSNGKNDPSFIREVLSYEIARKYMVAPQSNFAEVHINGNYHGMYVNSESINSDFQDDYLYADPDNTRFKCNPETVFGGNGSSLEYLGTDSAFYEDYYELKSDFGWQDLINLTYDIVNNPLNLESSLDIDRALWMLAFNNVLVNLDSYTGPFRQNYYLIKDDNNRMNPIIWDLNECLGGFEMINNGGGPPSLQNLIQLDPLIRINEADWPLIQTLLNNDTYQRMYIAHMRTILEENFLNGLYLTRANDLQSLVSSLIQADANSFYSFNDFLNNINNSVGGGPSGSVGITELMDARTNFLQSHSLFLVAPPSIGAVSSTPLQINPYTAPFITVDVSNATNVYLGYRFRPQDVFTKLEMFDDGMHGDGSAGDGIYGIDVIVDARDMQYYIYAENNDAGVFSPERAEHEYHYLPVVSDLVINELMASNTNAVADQNGEYDDWVELYNNGTNSIMLDGYFLSDNENNLGKWQFPNTVLPSGGYLTVWLDGQDGLQAGLHTSFKLSADGEELFLSTPTLDVVDAIFYTVLPTDMSFARVPNGTGPFTVQAHTNNANNNGVLEVSHLENEVLLYPNPTQSTLTIEHPSIEKIAIYDVMGKLMHLEKSNETTTINCEHWPAGMYIVKVGTQAHRLIIQ